MDKYFCVFKMPDQLKPTSVSFEAEHPGRAILKMMEVARVTNSMQLDAAEILKCVKLPDGNTGYVSVFLKESSDYKGKIQITQGSKPAPIIDAAVVDKQMSEGVKLDVYTKPYQTEVL